MSLPSHLFITIHQEGDAHRVVINDGRTPIVDEVVSPEDVPAKIDAHLVGLLGMNKAAA